MAHELREYRSHDEGGEGEGRHDDADGARPEPDLVAVDGHQEAVDVPPHVEETARDQRVLKRWHAQQVEHPRAAGARRMHRAGQGALAPPEEDQSNHRQRGERQHGAGMAEALDGEAGSHRPDGVRDREAEREPREGHRPLLRRAVGAEYAVHGDVHQHERRADERRGYVQHGDRRMEVGQRRPDGDQREADHHRPARPDAVDEPPGEDREEHRHQREAGDERSNREGGRAELKGKERGRHPAAHVAEVAEGVEQGEEPYLHERRLQTVIATPAHVTAMPTSVRPVGTMWNIAASSTTAKIGGRYIMLVTRVASPCRMRTCSALTARKEAKITRKAMEARSSPLHTTGKPSTATASGARTASDAPNCTTAAALRSAFGQKVFW